MSPVVLPKTDLFHLFIMPVVQHCAVISATAKLFVHTSGDNYLNVRNNKDDVSAYMTRAHVLHFIKHCVKYVSRETDDFDVVYFLIYWMY